LRDIQNVRLEDIVGADIVLAKQFMASVPNGRVPLADLVRRKNLGVPDRAIDQRRRVASGVRILLPARFQRTCFHASHFRSEVYVMMDMARF
jgi:hypothetical protein